MASDLVSRERYARHYFPKADAAELRRQAAAVEYGSPSIGEQLQFGARLFELDIAFDPTGGRFATDGLEAGLTPADRSELARPGFKVFHAVPYDMHSRCLLLRSCLDAVAKFHVANPGHLPIFLLFEAKDEWMRNSQAWSQLSTELRTAFGSDSLVLPGAVRDNNGAPRWPSIEAARGKIVPLLFDYQTDAIASYVAFAAGPGGEDFLHLPTSTGKFSATWRRHSNAEPADVKRSHREGYLTYSKADTMMQDDSVRTARTVVAGTNLIASDHVDWQRSGPPKLAFSSKLYRVLAQCDRP